MVTVGVFGILVAISEENKSTRKVFSSKAERYQELEGLKERRRKFGKKEVRPTFHFPLCELPCVTHFFFGGGQRHCDWLKNEIMTHFSELHSVTHFFTQFIDGSPISCRHSLS